MGGNRVNSSWALLCLATLLVATGCRDGSSADLGLDGGAGTDAGTADSGTMEPEDLPEMLVQITAPGQGAFLEAASVQVEGTSENAETATIFTLNGVTVTPDTNGDWSVQVPLDAEAVANPILAELSRSEDGAMVRDRVTVIAGSSVADGGFSEEGVAVRINDSAFDSIENFLADSVASELDLATLIPVGTRVIDNDCFIDGGLLGCLGRASVDVAAPAPSFASLGLQLDAKQDALAIDTRVTEIVIHLDILGSGLVPDCGLTITASETGIASSFALQPDPTDPSKIDVNSLGAPVLSFSGFVPSFSGACDAPIVGDIIQAALPDLEPLATDALAAVLQDPDGPGPADDPLSDAAELALADLSIAGSLGDAFMASLDAPFFAIPIDEAGMTLGSDGRVMSLMLAEGAPDLSASYHVDATFPVFDGNTPSGAPFGVGICLSPSFFNQLLKSIVEGGSLSSEITDLDSLALNAASLSLLLPGLEMLPPTTPMKLVLAPELAPLMTGAPGPKGELGELLLPHLRVDVRGTDDMVYASLVVDIRAGLDMVVDGEGKLTMVLAPPLPEDVMVMLLHTSVGGNEAIIESFVPNLIADALPDMAGALGSFPLPSLLGLELNIIETARQGAFFSIYADLLAP